MPTYAYRCTECGHEFDIYQQFSDAALTDCPQCDGKLRKVFGSLGVTFSGSGFYRTDSRNEGKAAAGAGSGAGSSSGSGGSSDSSASSGSSATSGSSASTSASTTAAS